MYFCGNFCVNALGKRCGGDYANHQQRQVGQQLIQRAVVGKARACAEHCPEKLPTFPQIVKRKQHPAKQNRKHCVNSPNKRRRFVKQYQQKQLFANQQHSVENSPKREIPACAVSNTRQQPHNRDVAYLHGKASAAAAERNVNVVAKPSAE